MCAVVHKLSFSMTALFQLKPTVQQRGRKEGEWGILQKRINSGSKVVGSLTERLDRDWLFDREA